MGFQVSWYKGTDPGTQIRGYREIQSADNVTIGREDGVDILLKDAAVSRLHAEIYLENNAMHVRDKGSSNGIRLDGKRVKEGDWRPGQKLAIGPFTLELKAQGAAMTRDLGPVNSRLSNNLSRAEEIAPKGRIQLGEVYRRAKQNDRQAVQEMFQGFLGRTEQVIDCGYLGSLGLIFPEHCFWCVTNSRVCGLMINYAGWVRFQFGFIKSLNRATFNQPSLVKLWIVIIGWLLFALFWTVGAIFAFIWGPVGILSFIGSLVVGAALFALTPVVVWLYYRYEKAGCVFWTRELVPIWIRSDRHSIRAAQRFISVFTDQKHQLDS